MSGFTGPTRPALQTCRRNCTCGHRRLHRAAQDDAVLVSVGSGQRDGAPREGFPGHGHARLLHRPPTRRGSGPVQREHEPALPGIPPQGHRDPRPPALPHDHRRGDQQPTPTPTRLPTPDRIICPTPGRRTPRCFHALTPPRTTRVFTVAR